MIGKQIKSILLKLGIEQKQVAIKSGITPAAINRFLEEKTDTRITTLSRMLKGAGLKGKLVIESKDEVISKIDL